MRELNSLDDSSRVFESLLDQALMRKQFDSMAGWFEHYKQTSGPFVQTIDRALMGGRLSQSVGFAFVSGYQSAIEALFGASASQTEREQGLASFCVTEAKGNHPRAIETRLYQQGGEYFIDGMKQFVSGAGDAQVLYVACRDETEGDGYDQAGRPKLKMVVVPTRSEGVVIEAMPALGFIPEVSHGKVRLGQVEIKERQVLEGDGYLNYVKAFRSYEDLHVLAAIVSYRLGEALDSNWGQEAILAHLPLILSLRALSAMPLNAPSAHLSLAACRRQIIDLFEVTNSLFEAQDPAAFKNWQRDQALLNIASKAQQSRTQKAWSQLGL